MAYSYRKRTFYVNIKFWFILRQFAWAWGAQTANILARLEWMYLSLCYRFLLRINTKVFKKHIIKYCLYNRQNRVGLINLMVNKQL